MYAYRQEAYHWPSVRWRSPTAIGRAESILMRKTFSTKKETIVWEVQERINEGQSNQAETPTVCLIDWTSKYLAFAESRFSRKTWSEKRSVFKRFFKYIDPNLATGDLPRGMVLDYLQEQV